MTFTKDQLAVAIEEVSEQFFVVDDEKLFSNQMLRRLFDNLIKDVRGGRPFGTTSSALAKLANEFGTIAASVGHYPNRLAERISGKPVRTAIDGQIVELEFSGPSAKHRRLSGTGIKDKRLYLEYQLKVVRLSDPADAQTPSRIDRDNPLPVSVVSIGNSEPEAILQALPSRIAAELSRMQLPRKPWQVPPAPADFVGRDAELSQITSDYVAGTTNIVGLQGPSGIGKTALGLAAVEQLHDRFGASIYLDLRGNTSQPLTSADALRHVARAFSPGASVPDDRAKLRALYQSILHETPTALFLENIATAAQISELVPPRNSLLIASSIVRLTFPGMLVCQLGPLDPESSAPFIAHIAPRATLHARRVAELCGHYPIALRAAAHAIAEHPTVSIESYFQHLHDAGARLHLVDPTADKSVVAVIAVSYSLLRTELQQRFDALGVFPATFDELAATAIWRCTAAQASDTLLALYRMSLVEHDGQTNRYRLHELLAVFAHSRLDPSRLAVINIRFKRHYRHVIHTEAWKIQSSPTLPAKDVLSLEMPNIKRVYDDAAATLTSSASRFMATFQWLDMKVAPISRAAATSWLLNGTRCTKSPRQRRLAALNVTRLALQYTRIGEPRKALQELRRLPGYIQRFTDLVTIQNIVATLHLLGRSDRRLREGILEFLLPFTRSQSCSTTQGLVFATIAAFYSDAGLHSQARDFAERGMAIVTADETRALCELVILSASLASETSAVSLDELGTRFLMRLTGGDAYDSLFAGVIAPQFAVRGHVQLAEEFYRLYTLGLQTGCRLPLDSVQLTNLGKMWSAASLFDIYPSRDARKCEERALLLFTEAERVARENGELEHYFYSAIPLGLMLAAQGKLGRAKELLPPTIYRSIARSGGAQRHALIVALFADLHA